MHDEADKGTMDPKQLYDSPFTNVAPSGPEQVLDIQGTSRMIEVIRGLNESATA